MGRILFYSLLWCAVAHADPLDDARQHYDAGTTAYNLGDFSKAVEEYKAAFTAKHDPLILYNIAQAARLGGDLTAALFFYKSYLRNLEHAPNRKEVKDRIVNLEKQIHEQGKPPNGPAPAPDLLPVKSGPDAHTQTQTPAPRAQPQSTATALTAESPPSARPRHKKLWVVAVVGVVVVGVALGVGLGVGLSSGPRPPPSNLGNTALYLMRF